MSIGQRLEEYIKLLNLTQEEIAFKAGVTRQTINNSINNNGNLSGNIIAKILITYPEIDANYLMTGRKNIKNYGITDTDTQKASEPAATYNKLLEAKDNEIAALKQVIEAQKEAIQALKK